MTPGELPESSDGTEGSDSISASETRSGALEVVGRLGSTGGAAKVPPPEARRPSGSGKPAGEDGREETESEMSKAGEVESSLSETPEHHRSRRLADWINPTGARKVHSLIDKVYKRKNLEIAWERVRANHGAGGIDGESIEAFGEGLEEHLARLHEELRTDSYAPQPVRQVRIPKVGKPGEWRMLGIPTILDRVCQQALLNRLEPIFEPVFDDANFGYRRGRSTKDALRKVWKEIEAGREWIVDADLKDFFGSVDHEKLLALVAQRVSDGRVLRLIEAMLTAGSYGEGRLFPTERGTPQGGVASPLLSNILLTPFDREMRSKGYQLTRYADDWVITCTSATEARAALGSASRVLKELGVNINPQKTRIVHVWHGFLQGSDPPAHAAQRSGEHPGADKTSQPRRAWLGPPLQAGSRPKALPPTRWLARAANLVASVRQMALLRLDNVATLQALRRVRACQSCRADPFHRHSEESVFVKAGCGKTARPVCAADGGQRESNRARLLRPNSWEADE